MEAANLTVSINGDASGLMSAVASANAGIGLLKSTAASALDSLSDKTVSVSARDNTAAGIASAKAALNSLSNKVVTVTVKYNTQAKTFAKGTMNADSGLAVVNDEKGISDPRELIYHRGKYMMYSGKDVIIPLDKGDKVYTASQTKAIMSGMGIPHYASGINNDLYEAERSNFQSRVKSSNVPIEEQISWWESAAQRYAYDYEIIKECSEEVFSLTRKLADSLNSVSDVYIKERAYFNDWDDYGDSALSAFERIKARNKEFLENGTITWEEYIKNVSSAGSTLYEERIEQSERWLKSEDENNNINIAQYIAGLNRMAEYTKEYYNSGLISYREYCEGMADIDNQISEKTEEKNEKLYLSWKSSARNWFKMRETYDDWEEFGDSQVKYYERCIERIGQLYHAGIIEWQTYSDEVMNYEMDLYKAQSDELDEALSVISDKISGLRSQFSAQEKALQDSWDVEDRAADIADVKAEAAMYRGSVTAKGQEKYEELRKELKELEREEELYELEKEHQEILETLQAAYDEAEADKRNILNGISGSNIDISDICSSLAGSFENYQVDIVSLLRQVISSIDNMEVNVYNNNSTTNNTSSVIAGGRTFAVSGGYYG